jgi:hypothetical protein
MVELRQCGWLGFPSKCADRRNCAAGRGGGVGGCSMVRLEDTATRFLLPRGLVGEEVAVFPGGGGAFCKCLMADAKSSLSMAAIME